MKELKTSVLSKEQIQKISDTLGELPITKVTGFC